MKVSDTKVGKTHRNRGAGKTQRKVTGIGIEFQPERRYSAERPDDMPGVEFEQGFGDWSLWTRADQPAPRPEPRRLWLDSFASWAGSEVTE
jgi:hypothetical protein